MVVLVTSGIQDIRWTKEINKQGAKNEINARNWRSSHFFKDFIYQTFTKGAVTPFHTTHCNMGTRSCTSP